MGFRTRAANVSGLESVRQSRTERPGRPGPPPTTQDRSHHAVQEHSLGPPHREGHPPRPGVPPSVQHRSFRGPHRGANPRRNLRWNFSMAYPTHAPPKEQASWLLGFPTSREYPMTWRVGWSRTYVTPPPPLRALQTRESWDTMGDPEDCWGISESTRVVQPTMANVFLKHARLNVYVVLSSSLRVNFTCVGWQSTM